MDDELYAVAAAELDAAYEAEGVTWEYHAWCDGVTGFQRDVAIGFIAAAGRHAMQKAAREYKDGLLGTGGTGE